MNFREEIEKSGAIQKGHFLLSSGNCSDTRINCEYIYKNAKHLRESMGGEIAEQFRDDKVSYVVGAADGGNTFAEWIASGLDKCSGYELGRNPQTLWIPSSKDGKKIVFDARIALVKGKKVVIADDVLSSGGTLLSVIKIVQNNGGEVAGVGVIYNRGDVLADDLKVPKLKSVVTHFIKSWPSDQCPQCDEDIPHDYPDNGGVEEPS